MGCWGGRLRGSERRQALAVCGGQWGSGLGAVAGTGCWLR